MSVYQVATELGVARRTLRNWVTKRAQILAYRGNKKRMKLTPGGRPEVFPDPPGLLEFIHGLRDSERALTTIHMVTWVKRNQREWLVSYLVDKKPGCGYNSLLLLLQRFCKQKHSMRMTAVLTAKADGSKLPILFIMKGTPGGRIETSEFPTFPAGHSYAVQEKAWMDGRVWKSYLRTVLHDHIEEASVILVDNFDSHVSEASYKIINEEL
ncbi:hypothetical protein DYB28_008927, partial [Aphanomyces astaci]